MMRKTVFGWVPNSKYAKLAEKEEHVIFGGRLGEYKYYDMDKVIASAMACAKEELNML